MATVLETMINLQNKYHPDIELPADRDFITIIQCIIYITYPLDDAHMLDDFFSSVDTSSLKCAQTAVEAARMFKTANMPGAFLRLINSDLFLNSAFVKLDEHEHSKEISLRLPFAFMIDNKHLLRKEIIEKMDQVATPIYSVGVGVGNEDVILCFEDGLQAYFSKALLARVSKFYEARLSFKRLREEEQESKEMEIIRIPFQYNETFWEQLYLADLHKKPLELKSAYDVLLADYLMIDNVVLSIPFEKLPVRELIQMYNVPLLERFEEKKIASEKVLAYYAPKFPPARHLNPKMQIRIEILNCIEGYGGLQDTVDSKILLDIITDLTSLCRNRNNPMEYRASSRWGAI